MTVSTAAPGCQVNESSATKMALHLLVLLLTPSHGFYLAGSTVRTDTSLAELLFSLLQPGARAQKRHKKQVRLKILEETKIPQSSSNLLPIDQN